MKARSLVLAIVALAILAAIGSVAPGTAQRVDAAATFPTGPFESWVIQQGEVVLEVDSQHPIFEYATRRALLPVGPVAHAEFCVGDYCRNFEVQWYEGPLDWAGSDLRWQRWVCFSIEGTASIECLTLDRQSSAVDPLHDVELVEVNGPTAACPPPLLARLLFLCV